MEKNRGTRAVAIVALLVAVVGISVAFAALGQLLSVTAGGKVPGGNGWDIKWTAATPSKSGSANTSYGSITSPTTFPATAAVDLVIEGIVLTTAEDKVEWVFRATNAGTFDAKLANLDLLDVDVTIDAEDESGIEASDIIVTYEKVVGASTAQIGLSETLAKASYTDYKLVIQLAADAPFPDEDVSISVEVYMPWVQQ